MGIFKFTKGIKILENSNLRPPCGWVNGQGIISVLESQAYLYPGKFWLRDGNSIETAKWKAPSNWQRVRRGTEWNSKWQDLILLISVHLKCSLLGWRSWPFTSRKASPPGQCWVMSTLGIRWKLRTLSKEKYGLVNKQSGHGSLQRDSCPSEV